MCGFRRVLFQILCVFCDVMESWIELGYFGLFLAAFLSATIIPLSSEGLLVLMASQYPDYFNLLIVASLGNWLGGMSTYYLGKWGANHWLSRFIRFDEQASNKWATRIRQYGPFFAILCWLPIVGDAIALALGVYQTKVGPTAIWMLVGKTLRYAIILAGMVAIFTPN